MRGGPFNKADRFAYLYSSSRSAAAEMFRSFNRPLHNHDRREKARNDCRGMGTGLAFFMEFKCKKGPALQMLDDGFESNWGKNHCPVRRGTIFHTSWPLFYI